MAAAVDEEEDEEEEAAEAEEAIVPWCVQNKNQCRFALNSAPL